MNAKSMIVLAVVAVAAAAAALVVHQSRRPEVSVQASADQYLLPELRDRVNHIRRVVLKKGEEEMTVEQRDDAWVDPSSDGYPVKFETVKQLLMQVSGLEIVEAKTANPDLLPRLGLQEPGAEDSTSALVELYESGEEPLAALIVGEQKYGAQPLVYVRKRGENQAWACKGGLRIDVSPHQWFDRQVTQIENTKVREVEIAHPDGETLRLHRESDAEKFQLDGVPEGRELTTPTVAEPIGSALGWLSFDEVRGAAAVPFGPDDTVVATFRCFDGLEVRAESVEHDGKAWFRFRASVAELPEDPEAAAGGQEPSGEAAAADPGSDPATDPAAEPGEEPDEPQRATQEDADERNRKWGGWVFVLQSYKADQLRRRMEALLKPLEPDEEPTETPVDEETDGG